MVGHSFIRKWTLGLLPPSGYCEYFCCEHKGIHFWVPAFNPSGYILRSGIAKSYGNAARLFEELPNCFSQHLHHFLSRSPPPCSAEGFRPETSSLTQSHGKKTHYFIYSLALWAIPPFTPSLTRCLWTPTRGDICALWPSPSVSPVEPQRQLARDSQVTTAVTVPSLPTSRFLVFLVLYSTHHPPRLGSARGRIFQERCQERRKMVSQFPPNHWSLYF